VEVGHVIACVCIVVSPVGLSFDIAVHTFCRAEVHLGGITGNASVPLQNHLCPFCLFAWRFVSLHTLVWCSISNDQPALLVCLALIFPLHTCQNYNCLSGRGVCHSLALLCKWVEHV